MRGLIISLAVLISSCNNSIQSPKISFVDSVKIQREVEKDVDSIINKITFNAIFDTVGLFTSPIKILSSRMIKRDYSNYKDIYISYKNISDKAIDGIRFRWYGLNAFNEPADMGTSILMAGFGGGFTDETLAPGKVGEGTWEIMSRDGKKIVLVWANEVAFKDGSKWKCGSKND